MAGRTENGVISRVAGEDITRHLRVKAGGTSGEVDIADDEAYIGTARVNAFTGDQVGVILTSVPGTHLYVAGGAIAADAAVTTAANGLVVTGTGGAVDLGTAVTATAGTGEIIEVLHTVVQPT